MHLVFADTFPGSALDSKMWDTCYPWATTGLGCTNYGNPELEWDLPTQVQVSRHALHLVAAQKPTPGTTRDGRPQNFEWRSGMVTTYRSRDFTYGYVAVRARVPKGAGLWSALYLLPQSQTWPPEIDLAEIYGIDTKHASVTFHPTTGAQFPSNIATSDLSLAWHTYAVDWERSSINWYIDGKRVDHYQGPRSPAWPMYFVADLAVADFFDVPPNASTPPVTSLDIQSVAIYQR